MTRWKNPLVWFRGLMAAFISGGAAAICSGALGALIAPGAFNLHDGFKNLLMMIGGTFLFQGILGVALYLQKSPLPELEEYDTQHVTKQMTRSDIGLNNPEK